MGTVAIRGSHASRLAAGCLAGVPGAVGVDHCDLRAESLQVQRRPQAERAGADHDNVWRVTGLHRGGAPAAGRRRRPSSPREPGRGRGLDEPTSIECHGLTCADPAGVRGGYAPVWRIDDECRAPGLDDRGASVIPKRRERSPAHLILLIWFGGRVDAFARMIAHDRCSAQDRGPIRPGC